ncbi:MAG: hypothetical protein ACUZ8O_02620 [Candidatus Anammoxibacter sp.]
MTLVVHFITAVYSVDEKTIKHATQALFDFDIAKYVSKKDIKSWK